MALNITFYDGIRYHRMDFINRDADFFGSGVVHLTDFPYSFDSTADMNMIIGAGVAWVDGYRIQNDSTSSVTLTVPAADTTNPRIDIVQIGHDDINALPSLVIKQGVASSSPVEPGADPGYLKLFAISVPANATSISSSSITDRRNLVPLNVSGTQINMAGAAGTAQANTFTETQTFSNSDAPINIPQLTQLPAVGPAGTLCIVNDMWYMSDGSKWNAMTSPSPPDASTTQAGIVEILDAPASGSTPIVITTDNANWKNFTQSPGRFFVSTVDGSKNLWFGTGSSAEPGDLAFGWQTDGSGKITAIQLSGVNNPPVKTNNNILDDGSGNMTVAGNITGYYPATLKQTSPATSTSDYWSPALHFQSTHWNGSSSVVNDAYIQGDNLGGFYFASNGSGASKQVFSVSNSGNATFSGSLATEKNTLDDGNGNMTVAKSLKVNGNNVATLDSTGNVPTSQLGNVPPSNLLTMPSAWIQ